MRVFADDDVRRVRARWLGPEGYTLPFAARYLAWGVFLALLALILLIEALTPLPLHYVPSYEIAVAMFLTAALMMFVDHDNTIRSVICDFWSEVGGPREAIQETRYTPQYSKVRVRSAAADADAAAAATNRAADEYQPPDVHRLKGGTDV